MRTSVGLKTSVAVLAALTGSLVGTVTGVAHGTAWHPGKPACADTWRHPHGATADTCRDHGWTINGRVVTNPHGVLVADRLPHCAVEDGSGRTTARCVWIGWQDGNHHGLSYWVDVHDRAHYVWPGSPVRYSVPKDGVRWVTRELGDALAEGGSPGADTRDWTTCIEMVGDTTIIRCPDSMRPVEAS